MKIAVTFCILGSLTAYAFSFHRRHRRGADESKTDQLDSSNLTSKFQPQLQATEEERAKFREFFNKNYPQIKTMLNIKDTNDFKDQIKITENQKEELKKLWGNVAANKTLSNENRAKFNQILTEEQKKKIADVGKKWSQMTKEMMKQCIQNNPACGQVPVKNSADGK